MTTTKYVALLRGINVGKAKRVPMVELRTLMEELGFSDVKTLLNSGNVVFSGAQAATRDLSLMIHKGIEARIGVSCPVVVLTGEQVHRIAAENALADTGEDPSQLMVSIVVGEAALRSLEPLTDQDWGEESFVLGSCAAYVAASNGVLKSEVLKAVERALGGQVTSRNWRTFQKLVALV